MLRISGYGQTGPYRDLPGFGAIGEAMGGLRHLTGEPGRVPVRCGISIGDTLAALHGTIGVLLALYHRKVNGGAGQVIDVALYEAVFNGMESLLPEYSAFGAVREAAGSALPGIAPTNAYRCADGYVLIAGNGDSIFRRLMAAIGRDDLGSDPDLASNAGRVARVDELDAAIGAWTPTRTVAEVLDVAGKAQRAGGRVYTAQGHRRRPALPRARHDPAAGDARRLELDVPGIVPKLSATPGTVRSSAPRLGDDTDAVLHEAGSPTERHRRARGKGVDGMNRRNVGNGDRQAHLHAGSRHARRPADRGGVRPDRRQDRADRRAVAGRPGEDRGRPPSSRPRRSPRCATPRPSCARSTRSRAWSTRCLVPNVRGAERAIDGEADEFNLVMSASETHNLANLRMTREQSFAALSEVPALAPAAACRSTSRCRARSAARWRAMCPSDGAGLVARASGGARRARHHAVRHHRHGVSDAGRAAHAPLPRALAEATSELTLHFHNTRGMGLANVLAGDRRRRRSLRCLARRPRRLPLRPGRHRQRVQRGDRARARAHGLRHRRRPRPADRSGERLPGLIGHDIPSQIVKAGPRLDLHPPPADFDAIRERALARDA